MKRPILAALLVMPTLAHAATQHVTLTPANTTSRLHAKTLVTSVDGTFEKVSGTLSYDPETQVCHVDMSMDVNSLKVGSAVLRTAMLSGLMLDSDSHPSMHFVGDCQPKITNGKLETLLVGKLTMRGQTHPLTFKVGMHFTRNTLTEISSTASFDQRQWGMSTMLDTVDPVVQTEAIISLK
ncbi:MAG: YceI family protein [Acetobacter sp.]|uniref:YceI family protein n=1 Tax=Acetobacter sp. TaxID=440 RepID=UPI0039EBF0F3